MQIQINTTDYVIFYYYLKVESFINIKKYDREICIKQNANIEKEIILVNSLK